MMKTAFMVGDPRLAGAYGAWAPRGAEGACGLPHFGQNLPPPIDEPQTLQKFPIFSSLEIRIQLKKVWKA
jgi:hypothetical protein